MSRAAGALAHAQRIILDGDGPRNLRVFKAAAWLGGGVITGVLSEAEALACIVHAGEAVGKPRREVEATAKRGLRKGAGSPWLERENDRVPTERPPRVVVPPERRLLAQAAEPPVRYEARADLCARKRIAPETLDRLGVAEARWHGRPALRWRVRTLDGAVVWRWRLLTLPKASFRWSVDANGADGVGHVEALYGVPGPGDALLVNGESSVWACAEHGIRAVTMALGEGAFTDRLLLALLQRSEHVHVAYDLDPTGEAAAVRVVEAIERLGGSARVLTLPADLGRGGDVCDLLARGRRNELEDLRWP